MSAVFTHQAAASYLDAPSRQVPGYAGLLRMTSLLLAERLPPDGRVLVLGAGGGLEIRALAQAYPDWTFDGVDPSAPMLDLAAGTIGPHADRVQLHEGYVDAAPQGPFHGATCILVLHFVPRAQRLETLRQLRQRLKPGAPLVLAHISFSQTEPERSQWIARHVAYGAADGASPDQMAGAREAIGTRLHILAPEDEVAMLAEAGFSGVTPFYLGFSIRGWVAYAQ